MISLTSLTIIQDYTLSPKEVRVHPDVADAVLAAFLREDLVQSIGLPTRAVIHPFTSVGDDVCECGETSIKECADRPSRHCGMWDKAS